MAKAKKVEQAVTVYALNEKAAALAELGVKNAANATLQAPAKGLGMAWRAAQYKAPNTRAHALATLPPQFSFDEAVECFTKAKAGGLNLGSGTPRSYAKAFVENGYFAEVAE